jgi:hypothetical protein
MEPSIEFLTVEECHQVDAALLTSREKFTVRVAIYALRSLKTIAQEQNSPIADLSQSAIVEWISADPSLQTQQDGSFRNFFVQIVLGALKPLREISAHLGVPIEQVTVPQVIAWYEVQAKATLEAEHSTQG